MVKWTIVKNSKHHWYGFFQVWEGRLHDDTVTSAVESMLDILVLKESYFWSSLYDVIIMDN